MRRKTNQLWEKNIQHYEWLPVGGRITQLYLHFQSLQIVYNYASICNENFSCVQFFLREKTVAPEPKGCIKLRKILSKQMPWIGCYLLLELLSYTSCLILIHSKHSVLIWFIIGRLRNAAHMYGSVD